MHLDEKGFCKERFILRIVPNMEKRKEGLGQTIESLKMSYEGPE
jgi:hypothetical protein